jgi:hypothetical protein
MCSTVDGQRYRWIKQLSIDDISFQEEPAAAASTAAAADDD